MAHRIVLFLFFISLGISQILSAQIDSLKSINPKIIGKENILCSIPFRFIDNRIYLQGSLNDKPCSFMYDIGSGGIGIDKSYAQQNNIGNRDQLEIRFNKYSITTSSYRLDDCKSLGSDADEGILGIDFFKDYLVEINYENHVLNLYNLNDSIDASYTKTDATKIKGLPLWGCFAINLEVRLKDGTVLKGKYAFDTGSTRNITILNPSNIERVSEFVIKNAENSSYFGNNKLKYFQVDRVFFNNSAFNNLIVDYSPDNEGELLKVIDGIIGGQFLQNFKILIDYEKGNLYMKNNPVMTSFVTSMYGNGIEFRDRRKDLGGLLVCRLTEHPNLISGDIKFNDLIIQINGIDVSRMEYDYLLKIHQAENNAINYKLKRGRKTIEVKTMTTRIL